MLEMRKPAVLMDLWKEAKGMMKVLSEAMNSVSFKCQALERVEEHRLRRFLTKW